MIIITAQNKQNNNPGLQLGDETNRGFKSSEILSLLPSGCKSSSLKRSCSSRQKKYMVGRKEGRKDTKSQRIYLPSYLPNILPSSFLVSSYDPLLCSDISNLFRLCSPSSPEKRWLFTFYLETDRDGLTPGQTLKQNQRALPQIYKLANLYLFII